jgi:hypothetical protein
VEKVVAHRETDGHTEFRIRWEGYGEKDDTWELGSSIDPDVIGSYYGWRARLWCARLWC